MVLRATGAGGRALVLTERVDSGGEGVVYRVDGSRLLAKLVLSDPRAAGPQPGGAQYSRRLDLLVATGRSPGIRPLHAAEPCRAAWPAERISALRGSAEGFLMPDLGRWHRRMDSYLAGEQRRTGFPGSSWLLAVRAAHALAELTAGLHAAGYVIGDLNPANLWMDGAGRVAVSDVDSFQFAADGQFFACAVRTPGYTAPELLGAPGRHPDRSCDGFALAVVLYRLLMCGLHPFQGVPGDGARYLGLDDNVLHGRCRLVDPGLVRPTPGSAPHPVLPRGIRGLFRRCFGAGLGEPSARPDALEWVRALTRYQGGEGLRNCARVSTHIFTAESPWCPWCDLIEQGVDCFPAARA
jgi:DNA-binding helix-hairpin-helix protein with protein kinase domain